MSSASLEMYPSGIKATKLYSQKPTDGTGDFAVARASSATRINKDGLIETVSSNVPRLNYPLIDGVVSGCPSLLLEPQETQLISYSNDFSNSDWQKYGVNLYYNSAIGIDGTLSATTLSRASGSTNRINQNKLLVAGNQYIISIYAKADSDKYITIGLVYGALNYSAVQFDLVNGIVLNSYSSGAFSVHSPKIEKMPNNWYRVSATVSPGINDSYPAFIASNTLWTSGSPGVFDPGDGVSGIYIQKPMFTNSTVLTSYIENTSAGTATRLADVVEKTGASSIIGQTEGTLFVEGNAKATGTGVGLNNSGYLLAISDGTISNQISIRLYPFDGIYYIQVRIAGASTTGSTYTPATLGENVKIAFAYKTNDFAIYVNGTQLYTSSSGAVPALSVISIGQLGGALDATVDVKNAQIYDTRLTNENLQTLTT